MKNEILSVLPGVLPWAEHLHIYESLPSTNQELKSLAENGAPQGTVVIAREQTAGRGRMGRSFFSQKDTGLYFSCLLRPACHPVELMHLTCATAVAACKAIHNASGAKPKVKWVNDLVLGNKKLGGILTELSINANTGLVDYAIIGIGINCSHQIFPGELSEIATSLLQAGCTECSPARLSAFLIHEFFALCQVLLSDKEAFIDAYRSLCVTLHNEVLVHTANHKYTAFAKDITQDGCLVVVLPDGSEEVLSSGEASVRGFYGYV